MARSTLQENELIYKSVYKASLKTSVNTSNITLADFNNIANKVKTIVFDVNPNDANQNTNFTTDVLNGFKIYNPLTNTFDTPTQPLVLTVNQQGSIDFYLDSTKTFIYAIQRIPTIANDCTARYVNTGTDLTINYNVTTPITFVNNGTKLYPRSVSYTLFNNGIRPTFTGRILLGAQINFTLNSNNGGLRAYFETNNINYIEQTLSTANVENTANSNRAQININSIVDCSANDEIWLKIGREIGNTVTAAANLLSGSKIFAVRLS